MRYTKDSVSGITLIALVITIIVLLILAGVTIASLIGENRIIGMSNRCKEPNRKGSICGKGEISGVE